MRRYFVWAVLVTVAGCGSGSSSMTSSGGNPSASTPVSIINYSFSPSSVTIKVGSTVTWTNNDATAHTTTSDGGTWSSGQLSSASTSAYGGTSAGGSYTYTFTSAGTFTYHCANHPPSSYPAFTGTITVAP